MTYATLVEHDVLGSESQPRHHGVRLSAAA